MKFCKKYEEYMQGQQRKHPGVAIKKLKKILKKCSRDCRSRKGLNEAFGVRKCSDQCPVCDGSFFPSLLNGMTEVVGCFNERAQQLLKLHLATGFRKYFFWFKGKFPGKETVLVQEGKDLVIYALINAIAIRKILKKYDKIHYSRQGQLFKSKAQSKHMEILQSPWLCELMAFHINLRESKNKSMRKPPAFFDGCSLTFTDDKPSLTCEPFDSINLDIDLTCSICLETLFDPVSLTCGHIFCYMCACSSASVTIVDGLKAANSNAKCPLCRLGGVYQGAVRLEELNILLGRRYDLACFIVYIAFSLAFPWIGLAKVRKWITKRNCRLWGGLAKDCKGYWEQRLQTERVERVKQIKEHWDSQCRAFVGV